MTLLDEQPTKTGFNEKALRVLSNTDQGRIVAAVVVALCIVFALTLDGFASFSNLTGVVSNTSVLGLLAIGLGIVVIGRGIDLSVLAIMGITSQLAVEFMRGGHSEVLSLLMALGVALLLGFINGFLVAYVEIQALFVTLATSLLFLGFFRLVWLRQLTIDSLPDQSTIIPNLAKTKVLGVPTPAILLLGFALLVHLFMSRLIMGRFVYGIGDNQLAAGLSGIPVRPLTVFTYMVAAAMAFVAGVVALGLAGSFDGRFITSGTLLYDALAVVVIGGVSLAGGRGSIGGILAGALFIGVLSNGMTLLNFDVIQQSFFKSVIILGALILDSWFHPRDEETVRPGEL
jgi:ribose transport system permease protein